MTELIRTLDHLAARIYGVPLLISGPRLELLESGFRNAMLQRGSREGRPPVLADPTTPLASGANGVERPHGYSIDHGVATLPIHGVLTSRVGKIAPDSTPMQSYENLSRVLHNAHRDQRVRGILLDIDSHGGEAAGAFEFADEIRALGQTKPIWAAAHHNALSAGYLLASAADRVWGSPSAALGSIGVIALHADQSEFDKREGRHYTFITHGSHKLYGNPHDALSPEARERIQAVVDHTAWKLHDYVGRGRHLDPRSVAATDARIYEADEALRLGLADRIGTLDQAHAALREHITPPARRAPMDEAPPPLAAEAPPDNVIQLREAVQAETRAQAKEIADLCALAGYPEVAAEHIGLGTHPDALRSLLMIRKASDVATRQLVPVDTTVARKAVSSQSIEEAAVARFKAQRTGLYRPE